ncbi:MAG: SLBB domain-containing protein, partial [Gemmatimonadetes bacterium]|nr:SLBB domain-containing protein [Gemmatimonadota bacterium]
ILLQVEGEKDFTDAFTVQAGPVIRLPVIGDVPLSGVRRAHLEPYLRQYLGRYLKNPVVRAQTLIRLSIVGEVEKPGFYTVPADVVLGDALMAAGGVTREAKFKSLAIDRKGEALWAGESLQLAIAEGRTVDQLGLRGGDRVVVPRESRRDPESTVRIISILVGLPMAIYAVTQIFP